ncbi:MAG: hypothetical protein Q8O67_13140 [Deltaproteobacteria bacterium]|nr:hypothetical protein [Deltaproteobacteria bacterium]
MKSGPVELRGTAENAKGGAVVVVAGQPIYLRNQAGWPDELRGTQVSVKGTLTSTKLLPSPVRAPDGAISQGAEGDQWVLDQWTVEPAK